MASGHKCPFCGSALKEALVHFDQRSASLIGLGRVERLTRKQAKVLALLWSRSPNFITGGEIYVHLHGRKMTTRGCATGVMDLIRRLAIIVIPFQMEIVTRTGPRGGYSLRLPRGERITAELINETPAAAAREAA